MHFRLIPLEDTHTSKVNFVKRSIRKIENNLLQVTEKLLARFIEEGEGMLVSELNDLIHALHRTALYAQRVKQIVLIKRLKKITLTKIN